MIYYRFLCNFNVRSLKLKKLDYSGLQLIDSLLIATRIIVDGIVQISRDKRETHVSKAGCFNMNQEKIQTVCSLWTF